jgi:hypothetical protein
MLGIAQIARSGPDYQAAGGQLGDLCRLDRKEVQDVWIGIGGGTEWDQQPWSGEQLKATEPTFLQRSDYLRVPLARIVHLCAGRAEQWRR